MKALAISALVLGIGLMALSGFQKIIIYAAQPELTTINSVIDQTPNYIWGITNATFWSGIFLFFAGLIMFIIDLDKDKKRFSK